jgi:hypothetical protein
MPNATVRANARTLPDPDPSTPEAALKQVLLAEHAKLTGGPLTRKRREAIATCDRLLSKLELLASLEMVR